MRCRNHLVIGFSCPRSGTKYAASALRLLGLRIGHEVVGRDGVIGWSHAVSPDLAKYRVAVRLLRDPLQVVSSCYANRIGIRQLGSTVARAASHDSWFCEYVRARRPILELVVAFCITWDRICDQAFTSHPGTKIVARVEETRWINEVADALGVERVSEDQVRMLMGRRLNHRRPHGLTMTELKAVCSSEIVTQFEARVRGYEAEGLGCCSQELNEVDGM